MKLRAVVAGFREQSRTGHALALLVGWLLFAGAYVAAVAVRGGLPLLWVTGAATFRFGGALAAAVPAGAYYGWLVTRARGGPTTNLLAIVLAPVALPDLVAYVLGGRVPAAVLGEGRWPALAVVTLAFAVGAAVVWLWGARRFDSTAERRDWLDEHLPESAAVELDAVTAERDESS